MYWCGFSSERQGIECGEEEVNMHISLQLAMEGDGWVQSD